MAVTAHQFTKFFASAGSKLVNIGSDQWRVVLATSATTGLATAQDTVQFMSDVKAVTGWTELANAAGGSSYVQNANSSSSGLALASVTWTLNASSHLYELTCANPSWTGCGSGFSPAYAIIFDATPGTDATNPALGWIDFGGTQAITGGATWSLGINGSGLYVMTGS